MSKRYIIILEAEMDNVLQSEKGWTKETSGHAKEIVYVFNLKTRPDFQVRIYSSVHMDSSLSRGVGQDAIRVCAINTRTQKGLAKSTRVNRVPGWETRVKERVIEVINKIKSY